MRFAYIDSQGNEVPIPSVDALALRIGLGAIGPDTQLYDAQADRWGPASSHEIFHTLSRAATEEGFVAPPPPVVPEEPAEPAEPAEPVAEAAPPPESGAASEPGEVAPSERGKAPPVFDLSDEFVAGSGEGGADEGSKAAEGADEGIERTADSSAAGSEPPAPGMDDLKLDLTFTDAGFPPAGAGERAAAQPPPEVPEPSAAEGPFGLEGSDVLEGRPPEASDAGGRDVERPLSDLTLESPTAWMARADDEGGGEASADDGTMRFDSGEAAPPEEAERRAGRATPVRPDRPARERPTPRNRPSPPRRVKRRSPVRTLGGIVVVAALAGGGWYGWQWYQARGAAANAAQPDAAQNSVTLPVIPAALLPRMRDLGNAALSATIAHLTDMEAGFHLDAEPNSQWLAGIYMANAGRYGGIRTYWQGIRDFVDTVRAVDAKVFHEEYVKQLQHAGITGDTARMLLDRADSGFAATRQGRQAAYSLMDNLVNASLNLHQFLVANQSQIEYEPAAGGVSRDPVLEAVPTSKQLGTEMWSRVDRITAALDSLGTLDKVTTEQLTTALFKRIRQAGFR